MSTKQKLPIFMTNLLIHCSVSTPDRVIAHCIMFLFCIHHGIKVLLLFSHHENISEIYYKCSMMDYHPSFNNLYFICWYSLCLTLVGWFWIQNFLQCIGHLVAWAFYKCKESFDSQFTIQLVVFQNFQRSLLQLKL